MELRWFQVSGGSVPGTDHTKPGKPGWTNNQDAFCWGSDQTIVAVICDGCGSGLHSEVGAKIASRLFTQAIASEGFAVVWDSAFIWNSIKDNVLSQIATIASAMGGSFSKTINDYFLFTMVGVIVTPWLTYLFSVGDGVFVLNGEIINLGPFPNNEPPYLSYNLTGSTLTDTNPDLLNVKVNRIIPTVELQSLVLGCDGVIDLIGAADKKMPHREELVGGIEQFWTNDLYFSNEDAIRRRLALTNKEGAEVLAPGKARVVGGLLPDDTTMIVIRRDPNKKEV